MTLTEHGELLSFITFMDSKRLGMSVEEYARWSGIAPFLARIANESPTEAAEVLPFKPRLVESGFNVVDDDNFVNVATARIRECERGIVITNRGGGKIASLTYHLNTFESVGVLNAIAFGILKEGDRS